MGTASVEPYKYVYRQLFQAQICGAMYPVDLSLERLSTRFSVSRQSIPVFSNKNERMVLCSKSFILSVAVWMFTEILSMPASQPPKVELPPTRAIAFPPLQKISVNCYLGFWRITAKIFV